MYSFKELFSAYLSAQTLDEFDSVDIKNCRLNTENRHLDLELYSDNYISSAKVNSLREEVKHALKLESVDLNIKYSSDSFCVSAVEDIIAEIRAKNIIFNGFFNKADFNLDGADLKITLKFGGYKKIQEGNFDNLFKSAVKSKFNIDVSLTFDGELESAPIVLPEPEAAVSAVKTQSESKKSASKPESIKEV